jgi:hypothetical protein
MSLNILLVSDQIIKDRTTIHGNIDPKLVYPHIKLAQDKFIEPLLGTALFDKLLNLIELQTISQPVNADYKTLLDRYIIDPLMYYVLAELPVPLSFQFWNKGVIRKQGEDTETPSMSELIDVSKTYLNNAEFYAGRLQKYLRQYAPTKYPEYLNPGNGVDAVRPTRTPFTMPVFLGDDFCCSDENDPNRFAKMYQGSQPRCCD